jgi:iron complex outermembrane receptor protein
MGGENSVDLNLIPTAAIERVEILKDGASATYGSDAIGGVINFITKKDYNGGSVSLGQSVAQAGGAQRTDFFGTFGKTFKRGSVTGIVQYRNNAELASADRAFTKVTNLANQGSGTSQVGQWTDAGGNNQFLSCPADQQVTDSSGSYCLFDYSKYSWEMPKISQYSTLLNAQYKLSENVKLKSQANFTYRDVQTRLAPAPGTLQITPAQAAAIGITNPAINPLNGLVDVRYRLLSAGTRDNQDQTTAYNVSQSVETKLGGSWTMDLTGSYADSRARGDGQGYADTRVLSGLVGNGWNPLLPLDQQGSIASAIIRPYDVTQSRQAEARAIATGQITDASSLAVGASTAWQMYRSEVDGVTAANANYGGNGGNGFGTRSYEAVFTEASIFPIEDLEIGLAARYDNYSDFGNTINPKLSLSWQANDQLMFRTSIGSGFRAPNLADLYNGGSLGYPRMRDAVGCAAAGNTGPTCSNRQYEVLTSSNPNLTQEKSLYYNAGFILQPKKNWSIESNMFIATIDDAVGALDMNQVMRAASVFGEQFLRDNYNIDIVRNGTGQIERINMLSAYNIATNIRQGLDFSVTTQSKANIGVPINVVFNMTHIQFLKTAGESFPGLGIQNSQDNYFKNNINLTTIRNDHSLRGTLRTISGGDKDANYGAVGAVGAGSLRTHTEFDLNYGKQNLFKKVGLNVGVKNLFDTARPLDETGQVALNAAIYDPIGRYYYTTLNYTF